MLCKEVGELLDAYALGALGPEETGPIEEHLADCLRCWEHLKESQKAAALLVLAVPLEQPREELRQRIIAEAAKEAGQEGRRRFRWRWWPGRRSGDR
jgi:anti-sigma factor RsiW